MKKELVVFIGNVGTGKTTYCNKHYVMGYKIIRPDDWREESLEDYSLKFNRTLRDHLRNGENVVIDGVNMKSRSREIILNFAKGDEYKKIAIVFGKGNDESLQRRIAEPKHYTKENIKTSHEQHLNEYESPTLEEGFDEIIEIEGGVLN